MAGSKSNRRALQRGRLSFTGASDEPFGDRWLVGLSHNGPKPSRGLFGLFATRARLKATASRDCHALMKLAAAYEIGVVIATGTVVVDVLLVVVGGTVVVVVDVVVVVVVVVVEVLVVVELVVVLGTVVVVVDVVVVTFDFGFCVVVGAGGMVGPMFTGRDSGGRLVGGSEVVVVVATVVVVVGALVVSVVVGAGLVVVGAVGRVVVGAGRVVVVVARVVVVATTARTRGAVV
jgi:hypothetical protein